MNSEENRIEVLPQPALDLSQLAPVVEQFQKGEIEKLRVQKNAEVTIAQAQIARAAASDQAAAGIALSQNNFKWVTTGLLYLMCLCLTGYGIWYRDPGFITAGISSFGTFLAGLHSGRSVSK